MKFNRHLFNRAATRAAGLLCLTAATGVCAEGNPYTATASQTLTRDTNVLRAPAALARSSTISLTSAAVGVDETISRQRLQAEVGVQAARYSSVSALNSVTPSLRATLNWQTIERLQGEVGFTHAQRQYLESTTSPVLAEKNLERSTDAFFRARLGVVTDWTLEADASLQRRDYSASTFANQAQRRHSLSAGARFQPQPDLSVRGTARLSRGEYPNFSATLGADEFDRTDLELGVNWRAGGSSSVDARLARSRESHSQAGTRSSSLWSGSVGAQWQPTGKVVLSTQLARDTDTGNQAFLSGTASNDVRLSTRWALGARWAATDKIQVNLRLQNTWRDLDTTAGSTQLQGEDALRQFGVDVAYQFSRTVGLGCSANDEQRSVGGNSALSYAYDARNLSCSVRLTLD